MGSSTCSSREVASAGSDVGDIHMDEYRVSANPNVADPNSRRRVLTIPHSADPTHNSGQLQFGDDGFLYVSVGDGNDGANAQSTENLLGKILRIDPHGASDGAYSSPPSNPFAGPIPGRDEIWALGFRNAYRFSFDHLTGDLAIGEVGDNSFEEIDFAPCFERVSREVRTSAGRIVRGSRGWGCRPAFTPPVFAYPHRPPGRAHRRLRLSRDRDPAAGGPLHLQRPLLQRSALDPAWISAREGRSV